MLEVLGPLQHRTRAGSSPAQLPPAPTSPSLCHPRQHHHYLQYSSQQELCPSPEQPAQVKKSTEHLSVSSRRGRGLQSLRKQALPSKSSSGRAGWSWHSEAQSSTGLEAARSACTEPCFCFQALREATGILHGMHKPLRGSRAGARARNPKRSQCKSVLPAAPSPKRLGEMSLALEAVVQGVSQPLLCLLDDCWP